ncbi:MAG: helical backbone metal receptor [Thermoanaerobaculum sp.]|nr:helical backbone metal receptor [Thermoanaerobaculum sp.]
MSSGLLGPRLIASPQRVVSLVPSLTEALFCLQAGHLLVGRTRYCVMPPEATTAAVVGGTKDVDVGAVLALKPQLVLAAKEENPRGKVTRLAQEVPVFLADPQGPEEVPALWRQLGGCLGHVERAEVLAQEVEQLLALPPLPALGAVYFVWAQPWMAAGPATYVSRLLAAAGFANAIAQQSRRYPQVGREQVLGAAIRVHFYPDEPYPFSLPADAARWGLPVTQAKGGNLLAGRVLCLAVSGANFTWYPSRTAEGLRQARGVRQHLAAEGL